MKREGICRRWTCSAEAMNRKEANPKKGEDNVFQWHLAQRSRGKAGAGSENPRKRQLKQIAFSNQKRGRQFVRMGREGKRSKEGSKRYARELTRKCKSGHLEIKTCRRENFTVRPLRGGGTR